MILSIALGIVVLPTIGAAQYLVDPPTIAAPDTIQDCTWWQVATANDTCASISEYWGISLEQLYTYNPSLAEGCDLIIGNSYCIEENFGIPPPTTTSTISSSTTSTSQTPTATPTTLLEACEAAAGGYSRYCSRCLYHCETSSYWEMCFDSVFSTLNYYDSQCWQHGGIDCANKAADIVCPQT